MRYSSINRLLACAIVVLGASVAHAQVTWTGTAANANWGTAGAFANASGPLTLPNNFSQALVFSGTNLLSSTNTLTGGTATSITFTGTGANAAGAFTLTGNAISLAGNIAFSGTPATPITQTIDLNLILVGASRAVNPITNSTVAINGVISGNSAFGRPANSGGVLVLTNPGNSFKGDLNIGSGTISVASVANIGVNSAIGSGTNINFGPNGGQRGTLTYTGTGGTTNRGLILSSTNSQVQTINSDGANGGSGLIFTGSLTHATLSGFTTTLTLGGTNTDANEIRSVLANNAAGGVLAVTKSGAGNWMLSGANSYSGATSISAGALTIQHASALGATSGTTTVSSGAALRLQGGIAVGAEPLRVGGNGVSSSGALRNLSGTNSFAGPITLTAATRVNSDADELTLSGPIGGAFGMTFGGAGATNVSGTIATGVGTVTKDGDGRLTLSVANSYTGLTTISNGTLAYGVSDALFDGGISVNGAAATLDIGEFADTVGAVTLTNGRIIGTTGTLTGASYTLSSGTVSAILGGSGAVSKTGAGTVVLNGANTLTGVTDIQGGTLSVTPVALATSSQINVGVNGSGGLNLFADNALATFTMANNASLFVGGTTTIGTLGFQLGSATTTYDNIVLQGSGAVTVGAGGGRIVVSGTTGFGSGRYTLLSGPNVITNASAFQVDSANSTSGYLYVLDSTTDPTQLVLTVGQAFNDLWWDGTVDSSWSTLAGSASNWSTTADGLTDAGSMPANITTVRFSAANVGPANVNTTIGYAAAIAGLDIGNTSASTLLIAPGTGGSLTTGTGGITLQAGAPATTISAPVTLGASQTWSVADAATTLTLSSTVAGDGQTLTKTGAGTLVLTGTHANTFSGTTTLAAGTLRVETSNAGALGTTALQLNAGQLQLASDASLNLGRPTTIGGDATIVTSRMSAGDGVTATLGTLSIGANTLTVATGTLATSGTQGLTFGAVTLTGNPTFALTNNTPGATLLLTTGAIATGGFTPTFTGSGNFVATGSIGGTGGVTWSSSGLYEANRTHGFTGPLTINAGTVRASTANGALGSGTLVLNGGTLDIASDTALNFARPTTVGGNVTIITERTTPGAGVTGTFGTLSIGSGTLTITSSPLTTSGTQGVRFTGVTLTGAPTFALANNTTAATLLLQTGGFTNNGYTITFTGSGDATIAANRFGSGGITWSSTGLFNLNNNHEFTGAFTINAGTVRASSLAANLGAGTLVLNGGTLDLVSSNGTNYGRDTTVGGNVTVLSERGSAGIGSTNTLGTLTIGNQTLTVASGAFTTSGTQGLTFGAVTLSGNPTFNVDNNTAGASLLLTLGALSGTDRMVTKAGSGTLLLSSSATATGLQVNVTGGALVVGHGNAFGDSAAGTTVTSGAELLLNPASGSIAVATQPLSIAGQGVTSGGALRSVSGSNTWQGKVTLTGNATIGAASGTRLTIDVASGNAIEATDFNLTFDGAGTTEVLDPISLGTGGLAQIGSGTTILGGSSTFSGPLSIAQGTLRIGGAGRLVGTTGTYASTITGSAETVFDYASSADSTLAGAISGGLVLVKTGAGTLTVSGSNAYSGGTQVNGGTLVTGDPSAYGTGSVTVASGGTLDLNNLSISNAIASGRGTIINAANFSGTSTVSGSTSYTGNVGGSVIIANGGAASFSGTVASLTINTGGRATLLNAASLPQASLTNDGVLAVNQSFDSSLATQIVGNGGLEKAGTGVLALLAASTYTGPTTVSAGGLVVNGSIASNVSIAAGAMLGGWGSVGAISGAGLVGPGNSPGILTATSVTPTDDLSFAFEFTQATPDYASPTAPGNDLLWLTGGTPFTSALDAANVVNIYLTEAAVELGTLTGGFYTADTVEFLGSISGASFNYYVQAAGGPVTYGGQTYQSLAAYDPAKSVNISTITANGGRVMQMVVVPEPGAAVLAGIGAALAGWRLARRRAT